MPGGNVRRIAFDAKQKLRIHQHRAERHFDARFKVAFRAPLPIELQRRLQILVVDRPPIGPARQVGKDSLGTVLFVVGTRWACR